jgi:hypothetical protein
MGCRVALSFPCRSQFRSVPAETPSSSAASAIRRYCLSERSPEPCFAIVYQTLLSLANREQAGSPARLGATATGSYHSPVQPNSQ